MRPLQLMRLALSVAVVACTAREARAWPPGGLLVFADYSHANGYTASAPDGSGGLYVSWYVHRIINGDGSNSAYLQHVTANGAIAAGWPLNGFPMPTTGTRQMCETLTPDGLGGVLVEWVDNPSGDENVYALRFQANGTVAPNWPTQGITLCSAAGDQGGANALSDGQGGALFVWGDYRNEPYFPEPYGIRILGNGSLAPGWTSNGRLVIGDGNATFHALVSDGAGGGVLIVGASDGVHVLRTDLDCNPAPGWSAYGTVGVQIAAGTGYNTSQCGDGAGGAYIYWTDWRTAPAGTPFSGLHPYMDIYGGHVLGNGTVAPGWPITGRPLCVADDMQDVPRGISDGLGGLYLTWQDTRQFPAVPYADIFGSHVLGDGSIAPGWPTTGKGIIQGPGYDNDVSLVSDGQGGVYVSASDVYENEYARIQHVHADGQYTYGPGGLIFAPPPTSGGQITTRLVTDGAGGAIVTWNGDVVELWAQHIVADGVTAIALSLYSSNATPDHVSLVWQGSGVSVASVERSLDGATWSQLARLSPDRDGFVRYEDRDVAAGQRYGYRLRYTGDSGTTTTAETWVLVPARYTLALAGFRPNPTTSADLAVSFELPGSSSGRIEVLDVSGRRIAERDLSNYSAGRYTERMAQGTSAPPGMYWLRLTYGNQVLTTRGVVLR